MKEKNDYNFCFRKAGGLKLIEPNENLVNVYGRKFKSALNILSSAIEKQEGEWILDTSYYAKYFIIYALFMKAGIKSEIHDCTIFALRKLFVDEGFIREDIHKELEKSRDLRVDSLYYDKDFGKEKIMKRAKVAPGFCLEVEEVIEKISQEEINKIRNKFAELKESSIKIEGD